MTHLLQDNPLEESTFSVGLIGINNVFKVEKNASYPALADGASRFTAPPRPQRAPQAQRAAPALKGLDRCRPRGPSMGQRRTSRTLA